MNKKLLAVITVVIAAVIMIFAVSIHSKDDATKAEAIDNSVPSTELTVTSEAAKIKEFTTAEADYFNDALFIGDSRTEGLKSFGEIKNADFFSSVGMNVYKVFDEKTEVNGKSTDLESLLKEKKYGKIYVMLGINELGYNRDTTVKKFTDFINTLRSLQKDAVIFIQANIHVGADRSEKDEICNNKNIDLFNTMISELADSESVFYIDINKLFDDESGNLNKVYTSDGTHLYPKYYSVWSDWLLTKAIV